MKTPSVCVRAIAGVVCSLAVAATLLAREQPKPARAEEKVELPDEKAKTYRTLFEKVGLSGLQDLTKDKDTSLALQASWESHKKLVKRTAKLKSYHPDDTYDAGEVKKFIEFLKGRTKAPVPDWWEKAILDLSVEKGEFSGYLGIDPGRKELVEIQVGKWVWRVKKGVEMTISGETYTYKSGGVVLEVPRPKEFEDLLRGNCATDASGEKITCLAAYNSVFAPGFIMAGFESKTGKRIWKAKVWAFAVPDHTGPSSGHRAELAVKGETVFVFGEEVHGVYLEAFDINTGKCQFRFCTCYWGDDSEKWNLKPSD